MRALDGLHESIRIPPPPSPRARAPRTSIPGRCMFYQESRLPCTSQQHLWDSHPPAAAALTIHLTASLSSTPFAKTQLLTALAGGIVNHGEGDYEASYVVTRAGEYQLVVGLAGDPAKSVFRGGCAPGPVSPGHCEVQHVKAEIAAGQAGQLRFWTADRWASVDTIWIIRQLQMQFSGAGTALNRRQVVLRLQSMMSRNSFDDSWIVMSDAEAALAAADANVLYMKTSSHTAI